MQLSPHFTLEEMIVTSRHGVDNTPDEMSCHRLVRLTNDFLEPIRARFGPLHINSGYRSPTLNAVIPGSAKDSAHCYGCAADIRPPSGVTPADMVRWIVRESGLDFDQVIDEERAGGRWLHIGMLRPGHEAKPRRQSLVNRDGVWSKFEV